MNGFADSLAPASQKPKAPLMINPVYTWQKPIADYARTRILNGATLMSTIESAAAKFEKAPTNYKSFMRLYGKDVREAKSEIEDKIGEMVWHRAKESDKILELLARSRGNFNPVDKLAVAEVEGDDLDDDSAVKSLMRMLGKGEEDDSSLEE